MTNLAITVLIIGAILLANEWWWRGKVHGEVSRKFVHITVGTFVAFWPLFLSWGQIELLSAAFVIAILVSQKLQIFKAIHSVQRPTYGEVYFGAAVGLIAALTHHPAIYAVALLHMSAADGLAAIVGVRYGARNAYTIFGSRKSLQGSLAFLAVSSLIMVGYALQQHTGFQASYVALVLAATLLENLAVRGLDNLVVPLLLAVALNQLK